MKKLLLIIIILISATFANAQWQQINGPYGGNIQSFAVKGTTILAGSYSNGVFRSEDNGDSWTLVNFGSIISTYSYQSFAVSGTTIFAGTWGSGVFRSADNGDSWTEVNSGLTTKLILSLTVSGTAIS